ncbi:MAG: Polymer-forming cytoskeletal [Bacillales bacterium]|jgi:cytoskeletal protein CcmA (bactofilin family)|nr:Polymer-forming cytoskeletal [Bacillales bacterium]
MDMKNNFKQALDQVFGIENEIITETEEDHVKNVLKNIESTRLTSNETLLNETTSNETTSNETTSNDTTPNDSTTSNETATNKMTPNVITSNKTTSNAISSNVTTVISEETTIVGSITSTSNIDIRGKIIGDIDGSSLLISGEIKGNVVGQEVNVTTGQILGDIKSASNVSVANKVIVNGNVSGNKIDIHGRVKGNLFADLAVIFKEAILVGDINAKEVSIEPGARIKGKVNIESDIQIDEVDINFDI